MLDKLTRDDFAKHLNETFRLLAKPNDLELELIEAEALPGTDADGRRQGFALIFLGPIEVLLKQMIYPLEHPEMGRLEIFLSPVGMDEHGVSYQAIFN